MVTSLECLVHHARNGEIAVNVDGLLKAMIAPQKTRYNVPTMDVKYVPYVKLRNHSAQAIRGCTDFK